MDFNIINFILFVFCISLTASIGARHNGVFEINVRKSIRVALLIFCFRREKLSVIWIISQIWLWICIIIFVIAQCIDLSFLTQWIAQPNETFTWMLKFLFLFVLVFGVLDYYVGCRFSEKTFKK